MKTTKRSPWSNGIGILLILAALFLYLGQYFFVFKQPVNDTAVYIVGGTGLIVWLGFSDEAFKNISSILKSRFGGKQQ